MVVANKSDVTVANKSDVTVANKSDVTVANKVGWGICRQYVCRQYVLSYLSPIRPGPLYESISSIKNPFHINSRRNAPLIGRQASVSKSGIVSFPFVFYLG